MGKYKIEDSLHIKLPENNDNYIIVQIIMRDGRKLQMDRLNMLTGIKDNDDKIINAMCATFENMFEEKSKISAENCTIFAKDISKIKIFDKHSKLLAEVKNI